jgi:hypothetical protein
MSSKSALRVIALLILSASALPQTALARTAPQRREVKVYLVALDDDGRSGQKIGCGDSLVAVSRRIGARRPTLRIAIQELLLTPHEYDARLRNFWRGRNLRVRSVSVSRGGVATIHIAGAGPQVAGVCDQPRIESQIEETAKQFPNVRRVRVFVNGRTLASAIR